MLKNPEIALKKGTTCELSVCAVHATCISSVPVAVTLSRIGGKGATKINAIKI